MNPLWGLRVIESPYIQDKMLLMVDMVVVPTNRTGWTFGWYLRLLLCHDIRWERP